MRESRSKIRKEQEKKNDKMRVERREENYKSQGRTNKIGE